MIYISVILSAYNDEKSVGPCLESVMAQDSADVQLECIVVDDASTDNTLAVARRTVGAYQGNIAFRIYRHQTHHGLARTHNTGLERASGYYVLFVNATDVLRPGCIDAYMVSLMRHWGVDVVAGNAYNVALQRNLFTSLASAMELRGKGAVLCYEMLRNHLYLYACNKLVRRELLMADHLVFDETLDYADLLWAFALFQRASSVVLLPDITYETGHREARPISVTTKWVNALLGSYAATADYLLDRSPRPESTDSGYYQAHQLFVYGLLSHADRLMEEYAVNSQTKRELSAVRSRLLTQTKNDGQKVLHLYFRQDGSFLGSIFKNPVFKTYNGVIADMTALLDVLTSR